MSIIGPANPQTMMRGLRSLTFLSGGVTIALTFALTQYKTELRGLTQAGLLKLVRKGFIAKERLGEDLAYVIDFERKYQSLCDRLHDDQKNMLLVLQTKYIRLLNEGQSSGFLMNFRSGMEALFDLHLNFHSPLERKQIVDLKQNVSHDYPQVAESVNLFIEQLSQYINDRNSGITGTKPDPLLLIGPSGVGKTRLIDVISTALNIPLYKASIAGKTATQLEGKNSANLCNGYELGILFDALHTASQANGTSPVIVFFDDLCAAFTKVLEVSEQQIFLTWLTGILDPSNKQIKTHMYNRYCFSKEGIALNTDDFIFIVAATQHHFLLSDGLTRRLNSRITFPALSLEKKKDILKQQSKALAENFEINLSDEDLMQIENIANFDPYPGAGTMLDTLGKWFTGKRSSEGCFNTEAYYQRLLTPAFEQERKAEVTVNVPVASGVKSQQMTNNVNC